MDGQQYLNQISRSVRKPHQLPGIFSSLIFKLVAIGVGVFILLFVIGSFLGGNKKDTKTNIITLNTHITNVNTTIETYRGNLKSSSLRSSTAALLSVLTATSRDLAGYISETATPESVTKQEESLSQKLNDELFTAKINGMLDRVFARKIAYEITYINNLIDSLYNETKDAELQAVLANTYSSLETLYANFNNYSK